MTLTPRFAGPVLGFVYLLGVTGLAWGHQSVEASSAEDHAAHQHLAQLDGNTEMDEHAAHRAALATPGYSVSKELYTIPDVALIDESGASVSLRSLLDSGEPVAVNFIFTTCTTICPVMTSIFTQMRHQLGDAGAGVRLVSISIDPEYDRPGKLKQYAEHFGAGPGWTFLTGDGADIAQVLHSFDALKGSKMNHRPLTLLKRPHSSEWIRIDGLASGDELAQEVSARLLN
jgi:protein SCO1/2